MARQLRARGDVVIGTVRDEAKAGALRETGAEIEVVDVSDPAAIERLGSRLGKRAIDVLVNNAGIGRFGGAVKDLTAEEMHRFFAVNAVGPILVVKALLGSLRAGATKKIASITSTMGSIGDNRSGGGYGYRSSKAALNMLNASLALELKSEGFTCVVLNPGWVQTDMGGPRAPTPVDVSVGGLLRVIDGATPADTGRFIDHDGRSVEW
jgi:NAD(P)-dependent dehydrogenase (short-subunit alcohol dehydrogenase family)